MTEVTQRDVIAALKEQKRDLEQKINACDAALAAFGVGSTNGYGVYKKGIVQRRARTISPNKIEQEVVRVLKEFGSPLSPRQIFETGNFDCTIHGVYHAVHRHQAFRVEKAGGRLRVYLEEDDDNLTAPT